MSLSAAQERARERKYYVMRYYQPWAGRWLEEGDKFKPEDGYVSLHGIYATYAAAVAAARGLLMSEHDPAFFETKYVVHEGTEDDGFEVDAVGADGSVFKVYIEVRYE